MNQPLTAPRLTFIDREPQSAAFADEVRAGLAAMPKRLSPKWFYDTLGSRLFDAICALPEYYPTRIEMDLFMRHGQAMAACAGPGRVLVELGSGAGEKVRHLLPHLEATAYVAVDISRDALLAAARTQAEETPLLPVFAVCDDFATGLELPPAIPDGPRLYFYPGSSIGNFTPEEAIALLSPLATPGNALLIGVDLIKDPAVLEAAYDDPLGVTAAFNRNLLVRMNRELDGNFDVSRFRHLARFDRGLGRIEMHLESGASQEVTVAGRTFRFGAGERLHTENSYKYRPDEFCAMAARAGWHHRGRWTDTDGWFAELYFEA